MKTQTQMKSAGYMPREIAVTLLTSPQSKTASFRRRCNRALEKVVEPVSRSTALNVSAPKTSQQRLQSRLTKATAAQLHKWHARALRRGNKYQDMLFGYPKIDDPAVQGDERLRKFWEQQIAMHDALCEAIQAELDNRRCRGKLKTL